MHYIITAFVLVAGLAPVCAQAQSSTTVSGKLPSVLAVSNNQPAVVQNAAISAQTQSDASLLPAELSPELKQERQQLNQEYVKFSAKQNKALREFVPTLAGKKRKEQSRLIREFRDKQRQESFQFNKQTRAKSFEIGIKHQEQQMSAVREKALGTDATLSATEKTEYLEHYKSQDRKRMLRKLDDIEYDEQAREEIAANHSLSRADRKTRIEKLGKKLQERHEKNRKKAIEQDEEEDAKFQAKMSELKEARLSAQKASAGKNNGQAVP